MARFQKKSKAGGELLVYVFYLACPDLVDLLLLVDHDQRRTSVCMIGLHHLLVFVYQHRQGYVKFSNGPVSAYIKPVIIDRENRNIIFAKFL